MALISKDLNNIASVLLFGVEIKIKEKILFLGDFFE